MPDTYTFSTISGQPKRLRLGTGKRTEVPSTSFAEWSKIEELLKARKLEETEFIYKKSGKAWKYHIYKPRYASRVFSRTTGAISDACC